MTLWPTCQVLCKHLSAESGNRENSFSKIKIEIAAKAQGLTSPASSPDLCPVTSHVAGDRWRPRVVTVVSETVFPRLLLPRRSDELIAPPRRQVILALEPSPAIRYRVSSSAAASASSRLRVTPTSASRWYRPTPPCAPFRFARWDPDRLECSPLGVDCLSSEFRSRVSPIWSLNR
jgi:hypothetical protein